MYYLTFGPQALYQNKTKESRVITNLYGHLKMSLIKVNSRTIMGRSTLWCSCCVFDHVIICCKVKNKIIIVIIIIVIDKQAQDTSLIKTLGVNK